MTGQDIIDASSSDIRKVLGNSGSDATVILGWVDRVHKEILRTSRWRFLLSAIQKFSTVIGTDLYYFGTGAPAGTGVTGVAATNTGLALSDVEFIKARSVIDRTNDKRLASSAEVPLGETWKANGRPTLYKFDSQSLADTLQLMPPPDGVYAMEFRYYKTRTVIAATGTTLQVPDDYRDIVIAGTNWFASMYLKKMDDASAWMQIYKDGLRQLVRDANLFPREDFIRPDYVAVPKDSPSIYDPFQSIF